MPVPAAILLLTAGASACPQAELEGRIRAIAQAASGRVGAAVMLIETGQTATWRGGDRFPMQSVYKVPIAMAVLHETEGGKLDLRERIHVTTADLAPREIGSPLRDAHPEGGEFDLSELLRAMIVESDGTASDLLLRRVSPERVTRYLRECGIDEIDVATTEREMASGPQVQYRNGSTPRAAVGLLAALVAGRCLGAESRRRLLGWMEESLPGSRRIKGLLPPGTRVAHKTGTSQTASGLTFATNDVGLATLPDGRHLALAIFVAESRAPVEIREAIIARIARAAWDCLAGGGP
ncbi:MAG TPA: class A beta-lactamase [Thermoanaerobaculia bacterium]|nr:class A beta-lactamase [Thermoanaerobaculia bacterium]